MLNPLRPLLEIVAALVGSSVVAIVFSGAIRMPEDAETLFQLATLVLSIFAIGFTKNHGSVLDGCVSA